VANEKHLRLTIHGAYVGSSESSEVWNFSLRQALVLGSVDDQGTFPNNWDVVPDFSTHTDTDWTTEKTWHASVGGGTVFDPESYLNDYVGATLQAFAAASNFSNRVTFLGANLYPCGTDGKAISGNYARLNFTTIPNGSNSTLQLPSENTLVCSWETHKIGRRGRGRIYPPVMGAGILTSDGLVDTSYVTAHRNAAKALVEGLSYSGVGPDTWSVRSVVTGPASSGGSAPYTKYATIIGVRVGRVMDTQRRRRRQLTENYSETPIVQV
jgi:hypothetical protein